MSGTRARLINCPCGKKNHYRDDDYGPNATVYYEVKKDRIYVEKRCYGCDDKQFISYFRNAHHLHPYQFKCKGRCWEMNFAVDAQVYPSAGPCDLGPAWK